MFRRMSLNTKLVTMFSVSAFLLLLVGGLGIRALNETGRLFDHVITINFPNTVSVGALKAHANDTLRLLLQLNLPGNDEKEITRLIGKLRDEIKAFEAADAAYQNIEFVPGEKEVYDAFKDQWKLVSKYVEESLPLVSSGSPADRIAFADLYRGPFQKVRAEFYLKTDALLKFHSEEGRKWTKAANDNSSFQATLTLLLVLFGFSVSLAMGIIYSRGLSKQLILVSQNIVNGANQVNSAASEIATSSESLSSSSSEQAAAVQETSSAVEELSAMVLKNSDNAERSREKATTSQEVAQRGQAVMNEMMNAISDINDSNNKIMTAVEESNRSISEITRVIMDIGAKTTVIKDIVFQTKLLSFNASVEAARAGEHGKGFSVVAEEVGNLAQMSGNAAQEISSTLEESIKKVNQIVSDTKQRVEGLIVQGKQKVEKGHTVASQCGEMLEQIVAEASDVCSMVVEISSASKEQSIGIQEINKAMSQMDTVTQQNAAVSQTSASASVELAAQAGSLTSLVAQMEAIVYGGAHSRDVTPSPQKQNSEETKVSKVLKFKKSHRGYEVPSYDDIKLSGDE